MENVGINAAYLFVQLINLSLIFLAILLAIVAFVRLSRREMRDEMRLIWALVILFIPILGSLAFLLSQPSPTVTEEAVPPR